MCITFILCTPLHVVNHQLKIRNIYVNDYFYCFVKKIFCKPDKINFKKLLTFFIHDKGAVKSQDLFSGNYQIIILVFKFTIAKILLQYFFQTDFPAAAFSLHTLTPVFLYQ